MQPSRRQDWAWRTWPPPVTSAVSPDIQPGGFGVHLTGPLRQRPPVLPLQARDQPGHILPHPGPRLSPPEPPRDPLVHPVQLSSDEIHHHALNDPSRIR